MSQRKTKGVKTEKQKAYLRNYIYSRRKTTRALVDDHLSQHPCVRCGERDIRVLQFHHRNPKTKQHAVGFMISKAMSWDLIKAEIDKCDVMCSNCHIRHHHEERVMNESVKRGRA